MGNKRNNQPDHGLQFNVAQLLKETTGALRRYDINNQVITKVSEDITVVSPLLGQITFLLAGTDILVTGSLETTVVQPCGRCLTSFSAALSIELEEQFHPTVDVTTGAAVPLPPDADEENRISSQHILDLKEVVRQELLLESESNRYCRPNCKGLCPQCGQDLNIDPCTCEEDAIDLRWAGLQALQQSTKREQ